MVSFLNYASAGSKSDYLAWTCILDPQIHFKDISSRLFNFNISVAYNRGNAFLCRHFEFVPSHSYR